MSGMQISVDLREQAEPHQVLRHVLAEDPDHAQPWIDRWEALGSTKAGRTEVAVRPLTHPDRKPEVTT